MEECSYNTEEEMLRGFLEKKEKAFDAVYNAFYGRLCYFAEKLILNRQGAEEIVLDVLVKAYRSGGSVSKINHLRNYLFEAVKNQCLNFLKSEKRYAEHLQQYREQIRLNIERADTELLETVTLELVYRASAGLPGECRKIFDMLYKKDMSYQEVADLLQLNVQTVRNQHARAIAHIRKKLPGKSP